jgi:beta-RFAP synthase
LGLIDLSGSLGRMFGGLGVGVDRPNIVIEAESAQGLTVTGQETQFVTELANRFFKAYQIKPNAHIDVKQSIPAHSGLGSGTQFALAVATALAKLNCLKATTPQLAFAMNRAKRTGVGTAIFEKGGFVVDGGKKIGESAGFPPLLYRQAFPDDWRFIIAVPNVAKGLCNSKEVSAFNKLPPMSEVEVAKICHLTMFQLLPALVEKDIENFGNALTAIQIITGNYFAHVQGGTYANKNVADIVEYIKNLGVYGAGQSSWGPAVYGVVKQNQAKPALQKLKKHLNKSGGGEAFIAKANNKGATIKIKNNNM